MSLTLTRLRSDGAKSGVAPRRSYDGDADHAQGDGTRRCASPTEDAEGTRNGRDASAVPALEECGPRGRNPPAGMRVPRETTPRLGVERERVRSDRVVPGSRRLAEDQVIEESAATVGPNDRLTVPVGCWPVSEVGVQTGPELGPMFVVVALVMIAGLDERNEPMPMQHGHVVVVIGRRVPAQKVIVVDAYFAGRVDGGGYCDSRPGATAREPR